MSESLLKALMQLFALVSDIRDESEISGREKNIVRSFLSRLLNMELVEKYMRFFDECLKLFYSNEMTESVISVTGSEDYKAMRIKNICDEINNEFRTKQKIYLIIQLIDFISYGTEITSRELDFLMTVALALNIPENEYKNIKGFILDPVSRLHEKNNLLLINNSQTVKYSKVKHICNSKVTGELRFLIIESAKTFIFRYSGDGVLFLNGQHVFPKQTYLFDNGSTIKVPGQKTLYYSEIFKFFSAEKLKSKVILTAKNIVFKYKDTENGIHNFSFQGESGQMVGILGVSGTGKSTLLEILNGNVKPYSGEIYINGYNLNDEKNRETLRGIIGYVPQDDLLIEELTVYQNLYYSARMCLDKFSNKRIKNIVKKVLNQLDLYEIRDLRVGDKLNKVISGGQRKRINIALELVREPHILFVDEPTSGLSSIDSEIVVNLLKEQTYEGKLVIVNIHQPSSDLYKLFDKVIILDKGGYQIYYGDPNEAIVYFKTLSEHANPEEDQCTKCGNINTEQILQIVEAKIIDECGRLTKTRKVSPVEWHNYFLKNIARKMNFSHGPPEKLPENYYSIPSVLRQMKIFFIRDALSKLANRQYLIISLLGAPFLAFVLGFFTKHNAGIEYRFADNENIPAYIFMCVITALFLGLILSSEEILKDRKILKRESFLNLSWFGYINSKIGMMFILSAIQTISFIIVGNLILEIRGMTIPYWIALFTTACCANLIGLNISSALNSVITIYILIPFIIIPQLLFSGVLVKFDKLHKLPGSTQEFVPLIGDVMTARWSFEALAVDQFSNNRFSKHFFPFNVEESQNFWYGSFLIPVLKEDLKKSYLPGTSGDFIESSFRRLKFHIYDLSEKAGFIVPEKIKTSLANNSLDVKEGNNLLIYLEFLRSHFLGIMKDARASKDSITASLESEIGVEGLLKLEEKYDSRQLKDIIILERVPGRKPLAVTERKIIQKYEPGYMKPVSVIGRAHLYAPYKMIGNIRINTFWFNMMVIWVVTGILYLMLYFRILYKMIIFAGDLFSKQSDFEKLDIIIENPA